MKNMTTPQKEIIYVGDPMCSWCWGFSPVLRKLRDTFSERLTFHLKVGGLRPGSKTPMDSNFCRYLRHHWDDVKESTGQMFNFAILERNDFIYDTEPACRATVCINQLAPDKTFDFFEMLQQSFYISNLNVTDIKVLSEIAANMGVERKAFEETFNSRTSIVITYEEFVAVRKLGVQGFPSLLFKLGEQFDFLARGYQPLHMLETKIEKWLAEQ